MLFMERQRIAILYQHTKQFRTVKEKKKTCRTRVGYNSKIFYHSINSFCHLRSFSEISFPSFFVDFFIGKA